LKKFFTNRELSLKFGINLAKWKRWSREFLSPDPLGGLQSGFARQYTIDDAFKIFLGGHLVAELKYTIPEANTILQDLKTWLKKDLFDLKAQADFKFKDTTNYMVGRYVIFIARQSVAAEPAAGFHYTVRGIISNRPAEYKGFQISEERYVETLIPPRDHQNNFSEMPSVRMLNFTAVVNQFIKALELS
jgi:hypothetical protein